VASGLISVGFGWRPFLDGEPKANVLAMTDDWQNRSDQELIEKADSPTGLTERVAAVIQGNELRINCVRRSLTELVEEGLKVVVEERGGRIEGAAQLDERLGPGIASEELVSRQEMKLAPMHPGIELAQ
jgi:hypothetical protein